MRRRPIGILIVGFPCGSQFVNRISVSDENWIGVRSYVPRDCRQKGKCPKIGIEGKVQAEKILCQITIVRQERTLMAELSPLTKMVMGRACLSTIYVNIFEAVSENEMRNKITCWSRRPYVNMRMFRRFARYVIRRARCTLVAIFAG
jgi:hypothetical protein